MTTQNTAFDSDNDIGIDTGIDINIENDNNGIISSYGNGSTIVLTKCHGTFFSEQLNLSLASNYCTVLIIKSVIKVFSTERF